MMPHKCVCDYEYDDEDKEVIARNVGNLMMCRHCANIVVVEADGMRPANEGDFARFSVEQRREIMETMERVKEEMSYV